MGNEKTLDKRSSLAPASSQPQRSSTPQIDFSVVGIGASAGGLAAFEAFFSKIPAGRDLGMAFVLVQHLSPDHKSLLSELLRGFTPLPVQEVTDGMRIQANGVYVIPPHVEMEVANGCLHLLEPSEPHGQRLPIDHFFASLSVAYGNSAIGIVLSGTGSDGTLGIRAIKNAGGLVMAQNNAPSAFEGMPQSALATGLVDYALAPQDMPAQLLAHVDRTGGRVSNQSPWAQTLPPSFLNPLGQIFDVLQRQTGHDFSKYKPSTIHRRIERRMVVNRIDTMERYVEVLEKSPSEAEALFRDFLIGVTHFFRDTEAFAFLSHSVIPRIFDAKTQGSTVRVWCTGCATGEEAYSIAMLLMEHMQSNQKNVTLQVFATDIDSRAIATARAGVYPASKLADVSPERLARFFTPEPGGLNYRIQKELRAVLVFSEQDLIRDPPFSKLDLVCCRNLLIYLSAELQKKIIPLFHYALQPHGWLFLGSSEGVGANESLFTAMDLRAKIFQRKDDPQNIHPTRLAPATVAGTPQSKLKMLQSTPESRKTLRERVEQALLRQVTPASVMVNALGDIFYVHGHTGLFLEASQGEVDVQNIFKMARPGLSPVLQKALEQSVKTQESVRNKAVQLKSKGNSVFVNLHVHVLARSIQDVGEAAMYLITLEELTPPESKKKKALTSTQSKWVGPDAQAHIHALTQELLEKDGHLKSTHDALEQSNSDLAVKVQDMQSINEELQSANEELETSKEELQSVNEELATVNAELQTKVSDLSHVNNDMNNLLAGTGVGTVFVDAQLKILRFTPAVSTIIHLIASDIGRSVGHVASNLVGYSSLVDDVNVVLQTLVPKVVEVQTTEKAWYSLHIQPYRTQTNVVKGAVISFENITAMVNAREALKQANHFLRLAVVVRDSSDAITVQDLEGKMLAWNPGAVRLYGWSEAEALNMNVRDRIPVALRDEALAKLVSLTRSEVLEGYRTQRLTASGQALDVYIVSSALIDEKGMLFGISTTERAKASVTA